MKLFGGILPFIGWRVVNVDNDGYPTESAAHFKADVLEVEWLGRGLILFIGKVYPAL